MAVIARLIGGAGTGKTTELLNIMSQLLERGIRDPYQIGFVSFTRAARAEASKRAAARFGVPPDDLERRGNFRTLHSICYRALGVDQNALVNGSAKSVEWLTDALQAPVKMAADPDADDAEVVFAPDTPAGKALALWSAARSRLGTLEEEWRASNLQDDMTPPWSTVVKIVERYEQAKRLDDRIDFVDMAGRFAGIRFDVEGPSEATLGPEGEVPGLPVWFFDEQQDASPLLDRVCHRLINTPSCKWVYVVGDPFQCQPAGARVLTTNRGEVPIEDLDPSTDLVMSFSQSDGLIYRTKGRKFELAQRAARASEILTITANGKKTRVTVNHQCLVRVRHGIAATWCCYLMRKGRRWRVGQSQLFTANPGKNGTFRLGQRTRIEAADAAWILSIHASQSDARIAEEIAGAKYGLPQICFRPCNGHFTQPFIDAVYAGLDQYELEARATQCLHDHGRDIRFPFWQPNDGRRYGRLFATKQYATNIIPEIMELPEDTGGKRLNWVPIDSIVRGNDATDDPEVVYSLDVERDHTYIADGFVTCNSIYGFAGADSRCFRNWAADKERIMPKSYRCPAVFLRLGENCLRPCADYFDRHIQPADHEGRLLEAIGLNCLTNIDASADTLLLARTNWHVKRICRLLDEHCIPWKPTKGNSSWLAPVRNSAIAALYNLEQGAPINGTEWRHILANVPSKIGDAPAFVHGTKKRFESAREADKYEWVTLAELEELGATPALLEAIRNRTWRSLVKNAHRTIQVLQRADGVELLNDPKIRVGTVHSVKGAEADKVYLLTSTSHLIERSQNASRALYDSERRVEYVALTRARHEMTLIKEPAEMRSGRYMKIAV